MVKSLDGLHLCEECGDEFAPRDMRGPICRDCHDTLGDDD